METSTGKYLLAWERHPFARVAISWCGNGATLNSQGLYLRYVASVLSYTRQMQILGGPHNNSGLWGHCLGQRV